MTAPPRSVSDAASVPSKGTPASMTVRERDGHCTWQTPPARALMLRYFPTPRTAPDRLPPEVLAWLHREALRRRAGASPAGLTVASRVGEPGQRLSFSLMGDDTALVGDGHWLLVLHEADDAEQLARLTRRWRLPPSDAVLLFWLSGEPTLPREAPSLGLDAAACEARLRALCRQLAVADPAQAVALARASLRA